MSSTLSNVATSTVTVIHDFLDDQESLNTHNWKTLSDINMQFLFADVLINRPNIFIPDPLTPLERSAIQRLDTEGLIRYVVHTMSQYAALAQSFKRFFESFGTEATSSIHERPMAILTPEQCAAESFWGIYRFMTDQETLLQSIRNVSECIATVAGPRAARQQQNYVIGTQRTDRPWRALFRQSMRLFDENPNQPFQMNECILRMALIMMLFKRSAHFYRQHFQMLHNVVLRLRLSISRFIQPFGMYNTTRAAMSLAARPQSVHIQRSLSPPIIIHVQRPQLTQSTIRDQRPQLPALTFCDQRPRLTPSMIRGHNLQPPSVSIPGQRLQFPPLTICDQRPRLAPSTICDQRLRLTPSTTRYQNLQPQSSTPFGQRPRSSLSIIREQTPPPLSTLSRTGTGWFRPNVLQRRVQPFQPVKPSLWIQRFQPADMLNPLALYMTSVSSPFFFGLQPLPLSHHSNQLDTTKAPRPDRILPK